jgi:hypothetical protein
MPASSPALEIARRDPTPYESGLNRVRYRYRLLTTNFTECFWPFRSSRPGVARSRPEGQPSRHHHRPPIELGALLRAIAGYSGQPTGAREPASGVSACGRKHALGGTAGKHAFRLSEWLGAMMSAFGGGAANLGGRMMSACDPKQTSRLTSFCVRLGPFAAHPSRSKVLSFNKLCKRVLRSRSCDDENLSR